MTPTVRRGLRGAPRALPGALAVALGLLLAGGAGCRDPKAMSGDGGVPDGGPPAEDAGPLPQFQWERVQLTGRVAMASLGSQVIRFGGESIDSLHGNQTWEWNRTSWKRLTPANSPPARTGHAMAALGNRIFLFGGVGEAGELGDTWAWDGTNWSELAVPGPSARHSHAMATLGNQIILFGGYRDTGVYGDTWAWDGVAWSRLTPPVSPLGRGRHALARCVNRLVMFGGETAMRGEFGPGGPGETWEWDGTTWKQVTGQGGPQWRRHGTLATFGDTVVLFGGEMAASNQFAFQPIGDTWTWDGESWTNQTSSSYFPGERYGAAAVSVDGGLLMFGGTSFFGDLGDTWRWDGTEWREAAPASVPAQRSQLAMARMGDKVLLFGGAGEMTYGDTWEWDGTAFTKRTPVMSPPLRRGHGMVSFRDKVLLFGGVNDAVFFADTWEWDGTNWSRRFSSSSPSPRDGHGMATLGDKVVLFGGGDAQTWVWDGATWANVAPSKSPSSRRDHAMATLNDRIVLFGGAKLDEVTGVIDLFEDTWTWDGAAWTPLSPRVAPGARLGAAMTAMDGRIFLYGGVYGATTFNDTWIWDGATWRRISTAAAPTVQFSAALASLGGSLLLVGTTSSPLASTWMLR